MAKQERRTDWGASGFRLVHQPYYGMTREQRLHEMDLDHLRKCVSCRDLWKETWRLIPNNRYKEELTMFIQRNHP